MQQENGDRWYGILPHNSRAGQVALGFFEQNGEGFVVIFFSREQGSEMLNRFASCFKPGEKDAVWTQLNDPEYLPESSEREPIVIRGAAGTTLCRHYQNYAPLAPADHQEYGYDMVEPRVIAYLYSADFHVGQWKWPKCAIIALKDRMGMYHVYIVFSDQEADRVLMLYPEASPDMAHYRNLMKQSPLPPSEQPTVYIGDGPSVVAARALCIYMEVPRWLGQGLDRAEKPAASA